MGGLKTGLRWRELWLELRALRGSAYDPVMDLLLALIFWSGMSSLQSRPGGRTNMLGFVYFKLPRLPRFMLQTRLS